MDQGSDHSRERRVRRHVAPAARVRALRAGRAQGDLRHPRDRHQQRRDARQHHVADGQPDLCHRVDRCRADGRAPVQSRPVGADSAAARPFLQRLELGVMMPSTEGTRHPLVMISAMYENGGNTTHRYLDGHPELLVYPFESQIGTRMVADGLASLFPVKYRWPVFALEATPFDDYKAIIDEEAKVRARTPQVSKFRHQPFDFSDDERCRIYQELVQTTGRSRAS